MNSPSPLRPHCLIQPPNKLRQTSFVAAALGSLAMLAGCTAPVAAPQSTTRALIEFRTPVDGAEASLLARLAAQSDSTIRHVQAVSASLHAYEITCVSNDPDCGTTVERLQNEPAILSVTPDRQRRYHTQP